MRIIIWRAGEVWFDWKHRQTLVLSLQYISLKRYKHFLCLCQSCKTKILTVKFGVYFFAVVVVFGNMLAFFHCAFAVFCSIILSFSMGKEVLLRRVSTPLPLKQSSRSRENESRARLLSKLSVAAFEAQGSL